MACSTPIAGQGTGSLAAAATAEVARASARKPIVSKCGRDRRGCESRNDCTAFMIDFSNLGR